MESLRLTPLDPSCPALDLLEDLLSGIHGCWLIYQEYVEPPGSSDEQGDAEDGKVMKNQMTHITRHGKRN